MIFSKGCEYAMQATVFLAGSGKGFLPVRRIGEELGVSPTFLANVLRALTKRGLLRSRRGPGGGVALAQPAEEISLKDIVLAIDGPGLFEECVLGLPGCGNREPCPLHEEWGPARSGLTAVFEETTVAALARDAGEHSALGYFPGSGAP